MNLAEHTLVAYLYVTVIGEDAERTTTAYEQLCGAWTRLAEALGLTDPATGCAAEPPGTPPATQRSALLAGRTAPSATGAGVREMWCNQVHDLVCVSVTLSRTGMPGPGWDGLYREWTRAVAGVAVDGLLGIAEVLTATTGQPDPVPLAEPTTNHVRAALPPEVAPDTAWETTRAATRNGLAVYHVNDRVDDQPRRRILAVLAPTGAAGDAALGEWLWQAGLSRLAMYLLHDAKLRHQERVLRRDQPALAQLRRDTGRTLARLQPLIANPAGYAPDELRNAHTQLIGLRAKTSGLIDSLARVAIMRRTITIAAANMAELTRDAVDPANRAIFDADQRLAQRLDVDLDDEHTYLTAASHRADHFAAAAAQEINRRQQDAQQANQHRENQFILFQTAIIGSILMTLTTVQALGYKIDIPGPTQSATIATLGSFALLLYAYALRRADLTQRPDQAGPAWINVLVTVAGGATAAGIVWTLTTLNLTALSLPAPTTTLITTVGTFAIVAASVAARLFRRRRK